MLIIDLLLDLLRLEALLPDFSVFGFLASRPVSRSKEPSLGLLLRDPGGASLDIVDGLDPLVGILDIFPGGPSVRVEKDGLKCFKKDLSGDDIRSSNVLCIKSSESKIQTYYNIHRCVL